MFTPNRVTPHGQNIYLNRAREQLLLGNGILRRVLACRIKFILRSPPRRAYPRSTRPVHKLLIYNLLANPFLRSRDSTGSVWVHAIAKCSTSCRKLRSTERKAGIIYPEPVSPLWDCVFGMPVRISGSAATNLDRGMTVSAPASSAAVAKSLSTWAQ